jgi:hypothetical protein
MAGHQAEEPKHRASLTGGCVSFVSCSCMLMVFDWPNTRTEAYEFGLP